MIKDLKSGFQIIGIDVSLISNIWSRYLTVDGCLIGGLKVKISFAMDLITQIWEESKNVSIWLTGLKAKSIRIWVLKWFAYQDVIWSSHLVSKTVSM